MNYYETAVKIITERFGRKQSVIFAHLEDLLIKLQAAKSETRSLRFMYDECEKHIWSLKSLDITEDKFGFVFILIILTKLPEELRIEFNRTNGLKDWELGTLRTLLKEKILAKELGEKWAPDNFVKRNDNKLPISTQDG